MKVKKLILMPITLIAIFLSMLPSMVVTAEHELSADELFASSTRNIKYYNVGLYYDSTCTTSATTLRSEYNNATTAFRAIFDMDLTLSANNVLLSSVLNGGNCSLGNNNACNTSCGALANCNTTHHKGASRLNALLTSSNFYIMRVVGHALCWWGDEYGGTPTHRTTIVGLGQVVGRNSIVSTNSTNLRRIMQHEISHNFGARHITCAGSSIVKCIIAGDINSWCSACSNNIWANR
ncbi:MAG: hypothetical protein FWE74_09380 [Oscillospiraceae bacterium]|nr:hypothetical protein [Oscillospiraceae bacterium]